MKQVDEAIEAGADFTVSPSFNPKTVQYCLDNNVVKQEMDFGLKTLNFF